MCNIWNAVESKYYEVQCLSECVGSSIAVCKQLYCKDIYKSLLMYLSTIRTSMRTINIIEIVLFFFYYVSIHYTAASNYECPQMEL